MCGKNKGIHEGSVQLYNTQSDMVYTIPDIELLELLRGALYSSGLFRCIST